MLKRVLLVTVTLSVLGGYVAFAEDSPEQVYQKYTAAIKSKNLDELKKYMSKKAINEMNAETPEMQKKMIEMIGTFMPESYKVLGQTIFPDGKTATLKLTGIGGVSGNDEMIGTVAMVKEDSGWKIDSENWSNKQP
ncbi:MAG: nuclear transport factor 2 family protein [Thermodesulfobacteriota bacterium]